jgi:hypothetical protein
MVRKAEKHLQMATLYEKLSANERASPETRIEFVRKANWHRILARMSAEIVELADKEKNDETLATSRYQENQHRVRVVAVGTGLTRARNRSRHC